MRERPRACRRLPAALFAPPARTGSARQHGPRACRRLPAALFALLFLGAGAGAGRASADLTVFAGRTSTPAAPATRGAALGISLQPAGVEFEYAGTPADRATGSPALRTGLFNLILGAPRRGRFRIYGSVGGGLYRQRLDTHARVGLAASAGGGVNVSLAEPLRVRLDYRALALRGAVSHRRQRRVYAGLNVAF